MNDATTLWTEKSQPDPLSETLQSKLANPERSSNFDLHGAVNQVLNDVGLSTADTGGKLTFYGSDPILQPAEVWDNGCNRSGCKECSGGRSLETSHR